MKAVVWTRYGPPEGLQLEEVAKPAPKRNQILVRVHATSVTAGDSELRRLRFSFLLRLFLRLYMGPVRPRRKILGQEFAGEIEAVGDQVTQFKRGDQVFGTTGFRFGAYAEYTCLPATSKDGAVTTKPANLTFEEAACVPTGGLEAAHFLGNGSTLRGKRVLINGAGGGIGTLAVQLAKSLGAEVTAVDCAEKLAMLRSLGADRVIDFAQTDFAKNGEIYDVIFDVVGNSSFADCLKSLSTGGRYLLANPKLSSMIRGAWVSRISPRRVEFGTSSKKIEDLVYLRGLIEAGSIRPVIDRSYPLEQVREAHRYVDAGKKKGNVVLTLDRVS